METALSSFKPPLRLKGRNIVILIGFFKLFKGALCILTAATAVALTNQSVSQHLRDWTGDLDVAPFRRHIGEWVENRVLRLNVRELVAGASVLAFYATLFFTEGFGLLFDKLWAEWMVVISSGGLIPFELLEIYNRHGKLMILTFIGNVLIVLYLYHHVRNRIRLHREHAANQAQTNSTGISTP
jgi:uncharacterized membrane protein (DUF2068 family)